MLGDSGRWVLVKTLPLPPLAVESQRFGSKWSRRDRHASHEHVSNASVLPVTISLPQFSRISSWPFEFKRFDGSVDKRVGFVQGIASSIPATFADRGRQT
jgi:hypothetical protein